MGEGSSRRGSWREVRSLDSKMTGTQEHEQKVDCLLPKTDFRGKSVSLGHKGGSYRWVVQKLLYKE